MQPRVARFAVIVVSLVACAALLVAYRGSFSRALVAATIDAASGYRVAFDTLDLRGDRATARDVTVERLGEPVLRAERVELRYRLRDLLPGGEHRFGLTAFEFDRPRLTLVRHRDGSFNFMARAVPVPQTPLGAGATALVPLRVRGTVRDGEIVLEDRFRVLPESRRLAIGALSGSVAIDSRGASTYHLRANLAADAAQPIVLDGRFDDAAGYGSHRFRGRGLAIAPVVNYFIDNVAARMQGGTARSADVRLYGFARGRGTPLTYHLGGALDLVGGAIKIPGLESPATEMTGRIDLFDAGLAAPSLAAKIGRLDVRVTGGLLDWQHLGFRLGLSAPRATLARIGSLFTFSRALPIAGDARLQTLVEGPVASPLVATRLAVPALAYAIFPVTDVAARVIYYDNAVDVVGLRAVYGGLDVGADGAIALGPQARSQLAIDITGPASRLPYLRELAPGAQIRSTALLAGPIQRLAARGTIAGGGAGTTIDGLFHLDPHGAGTFGPLQIEQAGGSSVAGALYLDPVASRSGFWLDARDAAYAGVAHGPRLPGLAVAAPEFRGRLDGGLAGVGPPSDFGIAGRIGARNLQVGTLRIDAMRGDLLGGIGGFRLGTVAAHGPWGSFAGRGAYVGDGLALDGNYRGSFAQLATLTGNLGGRGPLAGPVALLIDPRRTIVQARGATTPGASLLGVPVDGLSGTLAVTGKRLRIYAASGTVAGGRLVAAGTLDGPQSLGISAAGVATARLHGLLPLAGAGRLAAIGAYGLVGKEARFEGGLALGAGATLDRLPIVGNGDVMLLGRVLRFTGAEAQFGPALGTLAGSVTALGTRTPAYDTHLHLVAARLAPFVTAALPNEDDIAGTLVGDVRVFGKGQAVSLAGSVGIPEGSINGLAIRDAAVDVTLGPGGLAARRGRITVGSTRASFGAFVHGNDAALRLEAPHADLADFNDYFDAGDTLGGQGRFAARFAKSGAAVATNADIAIAGLKYRRFDLGDASARWASQGSKVTGAVAFGGASGRLETAGTLGLAAGAPLPNLLQRSRFDGTARLRGLDLGVWLPALGYQLPVLGRVDADATIAGPLRNPDVRTDATLRGGSIGAFPVDRLVLSASSTLLRTTVTRAELELPALSLAGSGTFGLRPRDAIAFGIHAKSANIGTLANRLAKLGGVSGTAEVDLKVEGTRARPRLTGGFDLEAASLRGVKVPRALGQFNVNGRDVVLSSVEVGFATGTLLLAGSVPLQVSPFALGPAPAPIALELGVKGIDLANFAPLLPTGSKLSGKLDGRVAVGGTAGTPRLNGTLALAGGTLASPYETYPFTNLAATLSFAGNDAKLEALHASAGGGSLDATGTATFPDLVRPGSDATYRIDARAKQLRLNLPAYGFGRIDGTLALAHRPQHVPVVEGKLSLADATIPFAALLIADPGAGNGLDAAPAPPPRAAAANAVALDLTVSAANNVRVRSSNVNIGGRGDLHLGGTTAAPQLDGGFDSTGGTLTYVNTVFRLIDGRVSFSPDLGLIPTLDARAVTHVSNPDPNTIRNVSGTADVTLDVTGPVTNLSIGLSSDPGYDRQQILGLLFSAPALGASNLFGESSGTPTLYGSTSPTGAAPGYVAGRSANPQFSVAQEAFGIANAQFTRTLLAPIETSFAQAVGLSNFNVNVDYSGAVGVTARKVLGKKLNAVYGTSFGFPYRQTFGFEVKPSESTAAQVTVFQTLGATGLTSLTPPSYQGSNLKLGAAQPSAGTTGFSLSLQRLFK